METAETVDRNLIANNFSYWEPHRVFHLGHKNEGNDRSQKELHAIESNGSVTQRFVLKTKYKELDVRTE